MPTLRIRDDKREEIVKRFELGHILSKDDIRYLVNASTMVKVVVGTQEYCYRTVGEASLDIFIAPTTSATPEFVDKTYSYYTPGASPTVKPSGYAGIFTPSPSYKP